MSEQAKVGRAHQQTGDRALTPSTVDPLPRHQFCKKCNRAMIPSQSLFCRTHRAQQS